jgi:ABC-type Fe3+ transport system permease subunit
MADPSPPPARPRSVIIAFWLLLVGAVLLILGGMLAATLTFETVRQVAAPSMSDEALRNTLTLHRASGVFCVLSGAALAFLAGKIRKADPRFRRATIALALTVVVLVGLIAVFVGTHVLALLGLLPVIVGAMLLSRPEAAHWYGAGAREDFVDG